MTALLEPCRHLSVLQIEGTLRAPVKGILGRRVQRLLERGERRIVLDMAWLSDIDAEGVGELARAYGMVSAAGSVLTIAHANRRVGELLQVAGLLKLLSGRAEDWPEMTGPRLSPSFVAKVSTLNFGDRHTIRRGIASLARINGSHASLRTVNLTREVVGGAMVTGVTPLPRREHGALEVADGASQSSRSPRDAEG